MLKSRARHVASLVVTVLVMTLATVATAAPATAHPWTPRESSAVVHEWERIAISTIYQLPAALGQRSPLIAATPVSVGVPYLGFTSLAMYQAAQAADRKHGSAAAAVAQAGHDVLVEYYPMWEPELKVRLKASLDSIPDGWAKYRGIDAGKRAAKSMIRSRAHDGRNDPKYVYAKTPAPGVWPPAATLPAEGMLAPWLGFMDRLVVNRAVKVGGPDALTSAQYTADYNEAKTLGRATESSRTPFQTSTAVFFNSNSATMVSEGLLAYLDNHPMSLEDTARMFARIHGSMTDAVVTCWRLKYEVGFWRPAQAIPGAGSDGNPATIPDASWKPLITNPPYSDYVSGHGCLTAPAVQIVRKTLGEGTALTLHSYTATTGKDWTFQNLTDIEDNAFGARIWGGLHFRTAMVDAYDIGHETADQVWRKLR